jgi:hypothetical protein
MREQGPYLHAALYQADVLAATGQLGMAAIGQIRLAVVRQRQLWARETYECPADHANRRGAAFLQMILVAACISIMHVI